MLGDVEAEPTPYGRPHEAPSCEGVGEAPEFGKRTPPLPETWRVGWGCRSTPSGSVWFDNPLGYDPQPYGPRVEE
jgi:hypothetical protein